MPLVLLIVVLGGATPTSFAMMVIKLARLDLREFEGGKLIDYSSVQTHASNPPIETGYAVLPVLEAQAAALRRII